MTQDMLESLFDKFLEAGQYDMMETYLEQVPHFPKYEEYRTKMFMAKAEDMTRLQVEEQGE